MGLYKIDNWEQAAAFEKWAKENDISFEELDIGNYADVCPKCGEYEFWLGGQCTHCGWGF